MKNFASGVHVVIQGIGTGVIVEITGIGAIGAITEIEMTVMIGTVMGMVEAIAGNVIITGIGIIIGMIDNIKEVTEMIGEIKVDTEMIDETEMEMVLIIITMIAETSNGSADITHSVIVFERAS